jgi:uncharacterized PurR-regulated membrane protein YhhQ (DUF165 family)
MRAAELAVIAVAILGVLLGSALRRFSRSSGFWASLGAQMLLRLTAGVIFAAVAFAAGANGGFQWILAVISGLLAVVTFAMSAFLIWGARKCGASDLNKIDP